MGAISKICKTKGTYSTIGGIINSVIDEDFRSRRGEEDMYRGDFGSSTYTGIKTLDGLEISKAISDNKKKKQAEIAYDYVENQVKKYVVEAVPVFLIGYLSYTLEPKFYHDVRGPFYLDGKEFKNKTELKKYVSDSYNNNLYGKKIDARGSFDSVGTVGYKSTRLYKTRPKTKPKKYKFLEPYYFFIYGGSTPY